MVTHIFRVLTFVGLLRLTKSTTIGLPQMDTYTYSNVTSASNLRIALLKKNYIVIAIEEIYRNKNIYTCREIQDTIINMVLGYD